MRPTDPVPILARHYRLQWEPRQQCHVLLYPEGMVKLNPSAGEILSACDGRATTTSIVGSLQQRYPGADGLDDDVRSFLYEAKSHGWIELRD